MKNTIFLFLLIIGLLLAGCRIYDGPPTEPDTPEPPAHSGLFISEHGTMSFPGDGKSSQAGIGVVTTERIPMLFQKEGAFLQILFQKEE